MRANLCTSIKILTVRGPSQLQAAVSQTVRCRLVVAVAVVADVARAAVAVAAADS